MQMDGAVVFLFVSSIFFRLSEATTEWFGDQRAHLNPPKAPAFYDIVYDDYDCPRGIESDAIPEYVYFGPLLSTFTVDDHGICLQRCLEEKRCQAVNYFKPFGSQQKGFCELLSETQRDNPRFMRSFRKATYYEHIQCKSEPEDYNDNTNSPSRTTGGKISERPAEKKEMSANLKKLSHQVSEFNRRFAFRSR